MLTTLAEAVPYNMAGEGRQKSNGEYLWFLEGLYDWTIPAGVVVNQTIFPSDAATPIGAQLAVDDIAAAEALNKEDYAVTFTTSTPPPMK